MRYLLLALGRLWLRTLRLHWPEGSSLPESAIVLLWHEHLPVCIRAFAQRSIHVLISKSADGNWAARACAAAGYHVHRGSSSRGPLEGMRTLARVLDRGPAIVGMALDGPRGPRRTPKPGSIWLSHRAGVPVIPVHVSASRSFRLGSWDRALIPWPFAKVEVRLGAAFHPETLEEIEEAMERLERGEAAPVSYISTSP